MKQIPPNKASQAQPLVGFLNGCPHCGQVVAFGETGLEQDGQFFITQDSIYLVASPASHYAPQTLENYRTAIISLKEFRLRVS